MSEARRHSLVKPTQDTCYHIDFDWWSQNDRDWHVYLRSLLCPEHQQSFAGIAEDEKVDWVDPETAEVFQVEGLQHILLSHCAQQEDFVNPHTALVEAIFRLFMKNGNTPMPVSEIALQLERPANTILKMLSGSRVYRGLRPILD